METQQSTQSTPATKGNHPCIRSEGGPQSSPCRCSEGGDNSYPCHNIADTGGLSLPQEKTPPTLPRAQPARLAFHTCDLAPAVNDALTDNPTDSVTPYPQGFAYKAINPDTGRLSEYRQLLHCSDGAHWKGGMCRELGRLFQGYKDTPGTNTCRWIYRNEMPPDCKAACVRIV